MLLLLLMMMLLMGRWGNLLWQSTSAVLWAEEPSSNQEYVRGNTYCTSISSGGNQQAAKAAAAAMSSLEEPRQESPDAPSDLRQRYLQRISSRTKVALVASLIVTLPASSMLDGNTDTAGSMRVLQGCSFFMMFYCRTLISIPSSKNPQVKEVGKSHPHYHRQL